MRPAQDSFNAFFKLVELEGFATKLAVPSVMPNTWSIWSCRTLHMTMGALVNVRKDAVKKGRRRRAALGQHDEVWLHLAKEGARVTVSRGDADSVAAWPREP